MAKESAFKEVASVVMPKNIDKLPDSDKAHIKRLIDGLAETVAETDDALLEKYLPKGLDAAKVEALVAEVIAATGAQTKKEMGKVIAALKQRPEAGLLDFGAVSKLVQSKLP